MVRKLLAVLFSIIVSPVGFSLQTRSNAVCAAQNMAAPSQPSATHAGQGLAIRVTVNSVILNVAVRDRESNRSIKGLRLGDFRVYEDGVSQQLQQAEITNAPFSLLLLMDVSGSTYSYMKMMKKAALEFLDEIDQNDTVAVAAFNRKVRLLQDYTPDLRRVSKAISHLYSDGGTAFYDALLTTVDRYVRREDGRKAVVVLTDGVDNSLEGKPREGSRASFKELYERLRETDAIIYTIFLDTEGKAIAPPSPKGGPSGNTRPKLGPFPLPLPVPSRPQLPFPMPLPRPVLLPSLIPGAKPQVRADDDEHNAYQAASIQLNAIAELTGGRMYSPHNLEELSGVYREIADDLRVQYLLSYASSNDAQDDGWRSIHVEVNEHPEAVVRTRKGYAVSVHHR